MAEKAQKGIVLSAGLVASVGLTTSFVVMMVKRFKRWQRNSETSRLAEAVVNQPFSVRVGNIQFFCCF